MAVIGGGYQGAGNIGPTFNRPNLSTPLTGAAGAAPGGPNAGYGRQALGDIDLVMTLVQLLRAMGANQSPGTGATGLDPSSLQCVGGKGGGLKRAGGKGIGRPQALAQLPGKGAPALKKAAGK